MAEENQNNLKKEQLPEEDLVEEQIRAEQSRILGAEELSAVTGGTSGCSYRGTARCTYDPYTCDSDYRRNCSFG